MPFTLADLELVDASVPSTANFLDAAQLLAETGLAAVAVVDEQRRVVGLFTDDDLVAGLFPRYLRELRHTMFALDDETVLAERARHMCVEPVLQCMSKPDTIHVDTSATHAAERFLHIERGAIAVVDARDRFVGMLTQTEFARRMLERLPRDE